MHNQRDNQGVPNVLVGISDLRLTDFYSSLHGFRVAVKMRERELLLGRGRELKNTMDRLNGCASSLQSPSRVQYIYSLCVKGEEQDEGSLF